MPTIHPPAAFSLSVVRCPSCQHGIDPHGIDPGGICGVGDAQAVPCDCRWSPNDIAGELIVEQANYAATIARMGRADD